MPRRLLSKLLSPALTGAAGAAAACSCRVGRGVVGGPTLPWRGSVRPARGLLTSSLRAGGAAHARSVALAASDEDQCCCRQCHNLLHIVHPFRPPTWHRKRPPLFGGNRNSD